MKKKKSSFLQNLSKTLDSGSNSKATPVVGVRGLDETQGHGDTNARDFAAIDKLEKEKPTEDEVAAFTKEGHLQ